MTRLGCLYRLAAMTFWFYDWLRLSSLLCSSQLRGMPVRSAVTSTRHTTVQSSTVASTGKNGWWHNRLRAPTADVANKTGQHWNVGRDGWRVRLDGRRQGSKHQSVDEHQWFTQHLYLTTVTSFCTNTPHHIIIITRDRFLEKELWERRVRGAEGWGVEEAERGVPSPPGLCPSQKKFSILCVK